MSATVAPEKILKELAALWWSRAGKPAPGAARLLHDAGDDGGGGEDTSRWARTIASLMPAHPARAILVRLRARVNARGASMYISSAGGLSVSASRSAAEGSMP